MNMPRRKVMTAIPVRQTGIIKRSALAKTLLQELNGTRRTDRRDRNAVWLAVEAAITAGELQPVTPGSTLFATAALFEWACNRTWRRTLTHLNALCAKCTLPHGATVRLRPLAKNEILRKRQNKTKRKMPSHETPEHLPTMSAELGTVGIFIDERKYPKDRKALLKIAKEQAIQLAVLREKTKP